MARPFKSGLDYFPLDVHDDDKMKFVRIKFKITGVAIVFELYRKIYAHSFYTKWNPDEALMFSDSIKADYEEVLSVVEECLNRGIFDLNVFNGYGVLTSKGIQDRFAEATWRRKGCKYNFNYFVNDSRLDTSSDEYEDINCINVNINPSSSVLNDSRSTQSKVKESKVNRKESKKKVKTLMVNPTDSPPTQEQIFKDSCLKGFEQWWVAYDRKTHKKDALKQWMKLSVVDMKKAVSVVKDYTEANDKQYRKDPHRYLRNKTFNDEIIVSKENQGKKNFKDALESLGYGSDKDLNTINEEDEVMSFRKLMAEPIQEAEYETQ